MDKDIITIFPDELEEFRAATHERLHILVDVRQPAEYAAGHIPGAVLIPLPEIEKRLDELGTDQDLIFYCRTGGRSAVAATLVRDAGISTGSIRHLVGGITGWDGQRLQDIPRLELFPRDMPLPQTLHRAMNMEKGAWLFYTSIAAEYEDGDLGEMTRKLGGMEKVHARTVFTYWQRHNQSTAPKNFEDLFDHLDGRIMEGGKPVAAWLARLGRDVQDRKLRLLELACEIEYHAYDLYRSLAARKLEPEARDAFFLLAEQEKAHIRILAQTLDDISAV